MSLEPVSLRQLEAQTEDVYESVVVMSKRARMILNNRIAQRDLEVQQSAEMGVYDPVLEMDPAEFVEQEKATSIAVREFLEGKIHWTRSSGNDEE
ncbi:MAG: DNA-directed RNA polymerase subunit omega [FCB group bacterium]|nr:DNA-directed RNA polymerase subunit omega [FCB group bacterium]